MLHGEMSQCRKALADVVLLFPQFRVDLAKRLHAPLDVRVPGCNAVNYAVRPDSVNPQESARRQAMLDKTTQDWKSLAAQLDIEGRAFIAGQYQDALCGETRATRSPANGQKLADVANCGTEDADRAVSIARAAFDSGAWSGMAQTLRCTVAGYRQFGDLEAGLQHTVVGTAHRIVGQRGRTARRRTAGIAGSR